jgi:hypothetical protein
MEFNPGSEKWWSYKSATDMYNRQRPKPTGLARMMVAAYKQRAAVQCLLDMIDRTTPKLTKEEREKLEKIRVQHAKYLAQGE